MADKPIVLSVALAVYNEEANLRECLISIADIAGEIVIVDGGSTDQTLIIAKDFNCKIIKTDNPPIFHINKQKALDASKGTWILQLDADEIIPEELKFEIRSVIRSADERYSGYYIARKNYFFNRWMKKGGMYPDNVIRLVKKGKAHFPCKSVHEQIAIDGEVGYLNNPMIHKPYPTMYEYFRKADTYTSLTAAEFRTAKVNKTIYNSIKYLIVKPLKTFISLYIRHQGFRDGYPGFLWALFSGLHFAQAYNKYLKMPYSI